MISSTRRVLVLSTLAWALAPLLAPLAHAASPIEAGGVTVDGASARAGPRRPSIGMMRRALTARLTALSVTPRWRAYSDIRTS